MTVTWHLRGFDKRTERESVDFIIPQAFVTRVRELFPQAKEDPELVDPHELTDDQALRVADVIGVTVDPARFDYSVESEEDWRIVAAQRDAMRART